MEFKSDQGKNASPWMDRLLVVAVIATMLLSLAGYMHA